MSESAQLPFPLPLILLDGAGSLLLALGIAERVGAVSLLSIMIPVPQIDLVAIVLGGIMMSVAMIGIVRAVRTRKR
ncbi:hypothetical protein E4T66_09950 [Sinimarinibacterium sp. CAU 1509]|uniref:hypothetical protein n=1 Tax=Sinimarinibacterium sp. CAU 1509 TaxID=2562283 RepID=UPI0010ACC8A6|nr:hypothetical protein [Sinimarinibacterium sp. CAU 1509]TJY60962.1 hypothetical protein E4T66_09950 [Sinimarinibacterium sp. CAU 1509]